MGITWEAGRGGPTVVATGKERICSKGDTGIIAWEITSNTLEQEGDNHWGYLCLLSTVDKDKGMTTCSRWGSSTCT